ncbi:MAG TPA: hypothetical protein VH724_17630 [Candidatus Angelobacter sp.]|nr:hypothetical protein [Candidatus Angelobacter sp.]
MKTAFTAVVALLFFVRYSAAAQAPAQAAPAQRIQQPVAPQPQQPPVANLNAILQEVQQVTSTTSVNISKLRIEKWKTDSEQRQQLQQIAESLQKNIANALPGMVTDVQSSRGSVAASFKLYHNLNVLYENLNYLADVAGSLGKKEEFEPLAADCASLESARKNLSVYIEQAAVRLESANRPPAGNATQARQAPGTPVSGKKVIVIDEDEQPAKKPARPTKKKTSPPPASPVTAPVQSAGSPH